MELGGTDVETDGRDTVCRLFIVHCGQMVDRAVMSNYSFNVQFVKNEGSGYSQHRNKILKIGQREVVFRIRRENFLIVFFFTMNIMSLLIMTPAGPMCIAVLQPGLALN